MEAVYELGTVDRGVIRSAMGVQIVILYSNAKRYGQNTIQKTDKFDWPVRTNAKGEYNIKGNKILATCFATDFFIPEADGWRKEVWSMIRQRRDIGFLILTKRIDRFLVSLPPDWGEGTTM